MAANANRDRGKRTTGDLTHIAETAGAPDEASRPDAAPCARCGETVCPVWLLTPRAPRWHVPRLCRECQAAEVAEREAERRQRVAREALHERIRAAGLASPHRSSRTFATFRRLTGTEEALDRAGEFARVMSADPSSISRGLFFIGVHPTERNGCGKTHLALAILHEVLASDTTRTGLFVEFADYLDALRRSFGASDSAPEWVRSAMFRVDLLVLDDIGAAAASRVGWDSEEMRRLLNHRIEAGRPIITTADVGPDELAGRLGQRIVSRLYEACEIVRVRAGDYRRRRKEA